MLRRARELDAQTVHLGMDAELEKRRIGAVGHKNCIYVFVRDTYQGAVMRELVADLATRKPVRC